MGIIHEYKERRTRPLVIMHQKGAVRSTCWKGTNRPPEAQQGLGARHREAGLKK